MSRRPLAALVTVLALVSCTDASRTPTAPSEPAGSAASSAAWDNAAAERVTASARWNLLTRQIISRRGGSANFAARAFALVSVAQYNAILAAEDAKERGMQPSLSGAAAGAAAAVLSALYVAERPFIAAMLAAESAHHPTHPSEGHRDLSAGIAIGEQVAAAVLAYAATDGSSAAGVVGPVGPGGWTPPPGRTPQDASWGSVRPWIMESGDQFHPAPPPAIGSPEFLQDVAEVRSFIPRTPDQLRIAEFWAFAYGAGGPAGYFGTLATQYAADQHLDERRTARVLAVLHTAIMDASIGCYEAKYTYWYLRPYQADGTIAVPSTITVPSFPAYPSAHSCLSSAAAGVLAGYFPARTDALSAMVAEAGMARIYAGLHYRFDVTAGQTLGYAVARLALRLAPNGHRPIALD